ncbi:MAG: PTS sugar transporter subunit IIA [Candidatus Aminicenantaceae bacterium]
MFGQTLRMLRAASGISLREMARRLDLSPAYLSQVERDQLPPPTYERIERIAGILGIPKSILQEMISRPDPEIMNILEETPALTRFIHAASEAGFNTKDYRDISHLINDLGVNGFRKLLRYGKNRAPDFKLSPRHSPPHSLSIENRFERIMLTSLQDGLIFPDLKHKDKNDLILFLLKKARQTHRYLDIDPLYQKIIRRENETSSGLGNAIAIPHLLADDIKDTILVLGKAPQGIAFNAVDQKPVCLISLILNNSRNFDFHLNLLAYLAGKTQQTHFMPAMMKAASEENMVELFTESISGFSHSGENAPEKL